MQEYDAIIVGGGVGGGEVALGMAQRNFKVAIVEERDWGGVTLNRGSTPKRALLSAVDAHYRLRNLGQPVLPLDWTKMASHSANVTFSASHRFNERLKSAGVVTIEGHADFLNPNEIMVHNVKYRSKYFVIATGARPRDLDFEGSEYSEHSASFLNSTFLPPKITIIGAGIISFALAGIASESGLKVTIIQHDDQALKNFDHELVNTLMESLKKSGVEFRFDESIEKIIPSNDIDRFIVTTSKSSFTTDAVYRVAGRVPNCEGMGLNNIGVLFGKHGIHVNKKLQTSVSNIFALGDCCDSPNPKLGNYAIYQGKYLGSSLGSAVQFEMNEPVPAMTVFSLPKLGRVGVNVESAEKNSDLKIKSIDLSKFQSYQRNGDDLAKIKLVINNSSQKIVGAEILSQDADQLTDYLALLMQQGISAEKLVKQIFAYPTQASDLYGIWRSN